jgi:hypothetical protein
MSTLTVTRETLTKGELWREWLKTYESRGEHSKVFLFTNFATEYQEHVDMGRRIPAGFGKHRASRYPHSSYNVVEDGQRDQIKAERLARRNAA